MMTLVIIIHVIICIALIGIVLIQRGRGSGLVESFSGVESMFGTKTNAFLTRTTTVLSILFFITCLSLAILSVKQSRSLLRNAKPISAPVAATTESQTQAPQTQAPQTQAPQTQAPQAQVPQAQAPQQVPVKEPVKQEAPGGQIPKTEQK